MASPCNPQTHRGVCPAWPAKGNKAREVSGRTAHGIRGYIRSMKRTKCRMQVNRGTQGRNTRAVNYTHPLETAVRQGRGTESAEGTSGDSEPHATAGHRRQECNGRQSRWMEPSGILIHMHIERVANQVQKDGATSGSGKDNAVKRSTQRVP